jgi:hypothetical protein
LKASCFGLPNGLDYLKQETAVGAHIPFHP